MKHFEKYCDEIENVENYDLAKADNFEDWNCHHRLETHNSDGERRLVDISREELLALNMYYHRPASELIFMRITEHTSLHTKGERNPMYGKHHSGETKNKISKAMKGKPSNTKGRHWNLSEEVKRKLINREDLSKKVLCVETGEVFESIKDAQRKTGIFQSGISKACRGKYKTAGKFHWEFFIDKD